MFISKTLKFGMTGATLLVAQMVMAEQIVDISFEAPLYCANERKSILYATTYFNKDVSTKIIDLAYFTDGYANIPTSHLYFARGYKVERDVLTVDLGMFIGSNALDYDTQKSGDFSYCKVTLESGWREKLKTVGDVQVYESGDFSAVCKLGHILSYDGLCQTSSRLNKKLLLQNPSGGEALPFAFKFTYKIVEQ